MRGLVDGDTVQTWIAHGRVAIEQTRLVVQRTAWLSDQRPESECCQDLSSIKLTGPQMLQGVADGPGEVQLRRIFRQEPSPAWGAADSPHITHGVTL